MGVVAAGMKIATLQGVLCAFLKMTEKEDCDGVPLHCCILLFSPVVSPQNALCPFFRRRRECTRRKTMEQMSAQKAQHFRLVYYDGK